MREETVRRAGDADDEGGKIRGVLAHVKSRGELMAVGYRLSAIGCG